MNPVERYKNLKLKAKKLMEKGMLNEYFRLLKEITRLENQIHTALLCN